MDGLLVQNGVCLVKLVVGRELRSWEFCKDMVHMESGAVWLITTWKSRGGQTPFGHVVLFWGDPKKWLGCPSWFPETTRMWVAQETNTRGTKENTENL